MLFIKIGGAVRSLIRLLGRGGILIALLAMRISNIMAISKESIRLIILAKYPPDKGSILSREGNCQSFLIESSNHQNFNIM
jgi:hypothetical protein